MKWVTCTLESGSERTGVVESSEVFLEPPGATLLALLEAGVDLDSEGHRLIDEGEMHPLDRVNLCAPLPTPPTMRDCLSHLDHLRNGLRARGVTDVLPEVWTRLPAFYFANTGSVVGAHDSVEVPPGCTQFDFELEVALVIGRGGRDIDYADALDHVAGYLLYCDWTARDQQAQERLLGIHPGKSKDSATTLGPWLVTRAEMAEFERPDGLDIAVSASVNGQPIVATTATGMYWSHADLIVYTSRGVSLRPGDVIASGTVPWGCLSEHKASPNFRGWLEPGDTVLIDGSVLGRTEQCVEQGPHIVAWPDSPARLIEGAQS